MPDGMKPLYLEKPQPSTTSKPQMKKTAEASHVEEIGAKSHNMKKKKRRKNDIGNAP